MERLDFLAECNESPGFQTSCNPSTKLNSFLNTWVFRLSATTVHVLDRCNESRGFQTSSKPYSELNSFLQTCTCWLCDASVKVFKPRELFTELNSFWKTWTFWLSATKIQVFKPPVTPLLSSTHFCTVGLLGRAQRKSTFSHLE